MLRIKAVSYSSIAFARHCAKFSVNTQGIIIQIYMWSKCESYLRKAFTEKMEAMFVNQQYKGIWLELTIKTTIPVCPVTQDQWDGI